MLDPFEREWPIMDDDAMCRYHCDREHGHCGDDCSRKYAHDGSCRCLRHQRQYEREKERRKGAGSPYGRSSSVRSLTEDDVKVLSGPPAPLKIDPRLSAQFDEMFESMQRPEAKASARRMFEATPAELGRAAVAAAIRESRDKTLTPDDVQGSFEKAKETDTIISIKKDDPVHSELRAMMERLASELFEERRFAEEQGVRGLLVRSERLREAEDRAEKTKEQLANCWGKIAGMQEKLVSQTKLAEAAARNAITQMEAREVLSNDIGRMGKELQDLRERNRFLEFENERLCDRVDSMRTKLNVIGLEIDRMKGE